VAGADRNNDCSPIECEAAVDLPPFCVSRQGGMMAKNHGSSVKDDEQYEALRREGENH